MGTNSKIGWTDTTWNPIVGCSHASTGCKNCYAERMGHRQCHLSMARTQGKGGIYAKVINGLIDHPKHGKWNGKTAFVESALSKPLHWKTPRNIFVCSMSDLFHESVPFEWIDKIFAVIWESYCRTSGHTFQFLTKRPERMAEYYNSKPWTRVHVIIKEMFGRNWGAGRLVYPSNVLLGVTAENQEMWDKRKEVFFSIPAALHFASHEPLLSAIEYTAADFKRLGWVICGGESGPGARPMHPDWARGLRDQCKAADVPFFFKQWGAWGICSPQDLKCKSIRQDGVIGETVVPFSCPMSRVGKKAAGCLLDGVEHKEFPKEG